MKRPWGPWDRVGLIFLACALVALAWAFYRLHLRLAPLLYPAK